MQPVPVIRYAGSAAGGGGGPAGVGDRGRVGGATGSADGRVRRRGACAGRSCGVLGIARWREDLAIDASYGCRSWLVLIHWSSSARAAPEARASRAAGRAAAMRTARSVDASGMATGQGCHRPPQ